MTVSDGSMVRIDAALRSYGFVLYSTPASVRARWPSILACLEVAIAVTLYWWIAVHFNTQKHLWISICVAPLLLLRSDESTVLGTKWFTAYIARNSTLARTTAAEGVRARSFWWVIGLSAVASTAISYSVSCLWLADQTGWPLFWRSAVLGWLSLNGGLGAAGAGAAVARAWAAAAAAVGVAAGLSVAGVEPGGIAAAEAVTTGGALAVAGAIATAGTGAISKATAPILAIAIAIAGATAIAIGIAELRVAADGGTEFGGLAIPAKSLAGGLAVIAVASRMWGAGTRGGALAIFGGIAVALLFFGLSLGHLLRAVWTRFLATLCHLSAGWKALPANWKRTLFSIDFAHPPELVPGYKGDSDFNFEVLYKRVKSNPNWDEDRVFSAVQMFLSFLPAYLYRLSIKSTFWLYWPLAYIADDGRSKTRPAVFLDRQSATPFAWMSALLAASTVFGFFVTNTVTHLSALLPAFLVSFKVGAIEFLLRLDLGAQKPWLWLSLLSAGITLVLFVWAGQMRPEFKHGDIDDETRGTIEKHIGWMRRIAKVGRISTILLTLSLAIYFLLWRSPLQCVLNDYEVYHVLGLLRWYYGENMPLGPACGLII